MSAPPCPRRRDLLKRVSIESVDSVVERVLNAADRAAASTRLAGFAFGNARSERAFISRLVRVLDVRGAEPLREFATGKKTRRNVAFFAAAFLAANGFARLIRVRANFPREAAADFYAVASSGGYLPNRSDGRAIRWASPVGESIVVFDDDRLVSIDGTRLLVGRDVEPSFALLDATRSHGAIR